MSPPRLLLAPAVRCLVFCAMSCIVFGAPAALCEMYKYTDSQGRLHFAQDLGQVPPEYRDQVERKELTREISVTGEVVRRDAMQKRSRALNARNVEARRRATAPRTAKPPGNPLSGSPPPKKYRQDCSNYTANHRCRKVVTARWRAWDAANGGNNGKPVTRRRIGK